MDDEVLSAISNIIQAQDIKKNLRHVYSGLTYQEARLNSGFPLPVQASVGLGRARGWHYSSPYPPEPMYRLRIKWQMEGVRDSNPPPPANTGEWLTTMLHQAQDISHSLAGFRL